MSSNNRDKEVGGQDNSFYSTEGKQPKLKPTICFYTCENPQVQSYIRLKSPAELGIADNQTQLTTSSNCKKRRLTTDVNENINKTISKAEMYKDMLTFSTQTRIWMHQANILCLIAYGNRINSIINDEFLMAGMLSMVPDALMPTGSIDADYFLDLVEWFRCVFILCNMKLEDVLDYKNFETVFQTKRVICLRDYIMLFISMLRALGFNARFVMSLQPYPININDFDVELSCDHEVIDTPGDYIISLKKGKGYFKSRKGKDLLTAATVERINNPVPIPKHGRERVAMKKYKSVLVCAVRRKNIKLDHWIEVFVKKERRWIPLNIVHQTMDDLGSVYDNLTMPLKYCLAWSNCDSVEEVTKFYAPDWYRGTSKRRTDKKWIDSTFSIFYDSAKCRHKK